MRSNRERVSILGTSRAGISPSPLGTHIPYEVMKFYKARVLLRRRAAKIAPSGESERERNGERERKKKISRTNSVEMARRRQRACVCACVAITHACVSRGITLAGGGHGARGAGRKGRNTCTAATQQFRVRCYVSESVMPMWAEANLWSPVSARTCVAFVYVRGTRNSRVTYAGTYRRLRTPLDPSLLLRPRR